MTASEGGPYCVPQTDWRWLHENPREPNFSSGLVPATAIDSKPGGLLSDQNLNGKAR
jgi:hypothetical protein